MTTTGRSDGECGEPDDHSAIERLCDPATGVLGAGKRRGWSLYDPRLFVTRREVERRGVDTEALTRRIGSVVEDVAEVAVAGGTADLDPAHPVGRVDLRAHVLVVGLEETRPPGP